MLFRSNSKSTRGGANSNRGEICEPKNTRGGNWTVKGIRGMSKTGRGKGGRGGAQTSRNAK